MAQITTIDPTQTTQITTIERNRPQQLFGVRGLVLLDLLFDERLVVFDLYHQQRAQRQRSGTSPRKRCGGWQKEGTGRPLRTLRGVRAGVCAGVCAAATGGRMLFAASKGTGHFLVMLREFLQRLLRLRRLRLGVCERFLGRGRSGGVAFFGRLLRLLEVLVRVLTGAEEEAERGEWRKGKVKIRRCAWGPSGGGGMVESTGLLLEHSG